MNVETEAKFRARDFAPIRKKLKLLGAKKVSCVFEHNIALDDEKGTLQGSDRLLRIRKDRKVTLTYKGPKLARDMKSREEIEFEASSFEKAAEVLNRLGFTKTLVYDKKRETWQYKKTEIALDEMPFGKFVEIEGEQKGIMALANSLGFSEKGIITKTYLELARDAGIKGDIVFGKR